MWPSCKELEGPALAPGLSGQEIVGRNAVGPSEAGLPGGPPLQEGGHGAAGPGSSGKKSGGPVPLILHGTAGQAVVLPGCLKGDDLGGPLAPLERCTEWSLYIQRTSCLLLLELSPLKAVCSLSAVSVPLGDKTPELVGSGKWSSLNEQTMCSRE